jgi:hypothetical protein
MKKEESLATKNLGQKDIPTMLELVDEQIKQIKKGLPDSPHTDKDLPGIGKISTLKTVDSLLKAASMIIAKEDAYNKAAEKVLPEGFKKPLFKLNGVSAKLWIEDISARVVIVANKEQLNKLEKVKKKLEENLSAESKLARDLEEIQSILKVDDGEEG